jgi:hypothetical protein
LQAVEFLKAKSPRGCASFLEPESELRGDSVLSEPGSLLRGRGLCVGVGLDILRDGACEREEFLVALGVACLNRSWSDSSPLNTWVHFSC